MYTDPHDPDPHRNRQPTDRGVTPVIGIILMVGITVLLAASIAAFTLGLAGDADEGARAAVDVSDLSPGENGSVTVQVLNMETASEVEITATVTSGEARLDDGSGGSTDEVVKIRDTPGSVTFEENSPDDERTTVEIIAIADSGTAESVMLEDSVSI